MIRKLSFLFFLPLLLLYSCNNAPKSGPYISISGFTQGTTYHITYQSPGKDSLNLKDEIESLLQVFDQSLSTYISTSNISKLNRNETNRVDDYFKTVFDEAYRIYEISDGAFDITVGPLIDAWGFGPGKKIEMSASVIDSIMQFVGMDKVRVQDGNLIKDLPGIRIDFNAIAQGYSVDVVAEFLEELKIYNYMVEIGGEIRALGVSHRNDSWKIGIDKPFFGNQLPGQSLQAIVRLSGQSLASSGNYRKFYEKDGQKIVHTVDPKTGYTKMSNLLSATIIAEKCITADAIATSCLSMGLERAREFINKQRDIEALFVYTDDEGNYLEWMTDGMQEIIKK